MCWPLEDAENIVARGQGTFAHVALPVSYRWNSSEDFMLMREWLAQYTLDEMKVLLRGLLVMCTKLSIDAKGNRNAKRTWEKVHARLLGLSRRWIES